MATSDLTLDERIHNSLLATHATLAQRGELLTAERLQACYRIRAGGGVRRGAGFLTQVTRCIFPLAMPRRARMRE